MSQVNTRIIYGALLALPCALLAVWFSIGGVSSTARVNHLEIILNDTQVTEQDFFKYLDTLDHKLEITCDVYDVASEQYIQNTFLSKMKSKMAERDLLASLVHIEVVLE